jgi:hypothetical protein
VLGSIFGNVHTSLGRFLENPEISDYTDQKLITQMENLSKN